MNIRWYGQACFRLESKDVSLLMDPFSKDIGLRLPRLNDQIIVVSHEHYDHNNVAEAPAESFIIRGPGEYEKSGIYIQGIQSYHDNLNGSQRGFNTISIITMEDMRLCHLGDLGQDVLSAEQIEEIGDVDIMFVPIGGTYTIDAATAIKIIKQVEPKIIVPMHYKISGLTIDLDGPEKFLKEIALVPEEVEVFKIAKKNLPTEELKLVLFKF